MELDWLGRGAYDAESKTHSIKQINHSVEFRSLSYSFAFPICLALPSTAVCFPFRGFLSLSPLPLSLSMRQRRFHLALSLFPMCTERAAYIYSMKCLRNRYDTSHPELFIAIRWLKYSFISFRLPPLHKNRIYFPNKNSIFSCRLFAIADLRIFGRPNCCRSRATNSTIHQFYEDRQNNSELGTNLHRRDRANEPCRSRNRRAEHFFVRNDFCATN